MTDKETVQAIFDVCGIRYHDYGYALGDLGWSLSFTDGELRSYHSSFPPGIWWTRSDMATTTTTADAETMPRGIE